MTLRIMRTLLTVMTTAGLAVAQTSPTLSVSVDRGQIYLGEAVLLNVRVAGVDDPSAEPDLTAIPGAAVRAIDSQSISRHNVTIINGRMTREDFVGREFTYEVTPASVGTLRLGPVRLTVRGRALTDQGPQVTVTGVERQALVSVEVRSTREAVLIDEPFEITLRVRVLGLPPGFAEYEPLVPGRPPQLQIPYLGGELKGLQGPDIHALLQNILVQGRNRPGFRINDFTIQNDPFGGMFSLGLSLNRLRPQPATFALAPRQSTTAGVVTWEYTLTTRYVPKDEGSHAFGPVLFKGDVLTGVTASGQPQTRPVFAVGPAVTVRVVPPPEEGRPDWYLGVLGSNLTVQATLDTQTCVVGDPLCLTLRIGGGVNLDKLKLPPVWEQPALTRSFRVIADTLQRHRREGAIAYTLTIRPTQAGTLEIPPFRLAYFDTAARQYKTATTAPLPVQVNEATLLSADHIINIGTNSAAAGDSRWGAARPPAGITTAKTGSLQEVLVGGRPQMAVALVGPAVFALTGTIMLGARLLRHRRTRARGRGALRRALRQVRACVTDQSAGGLALSRAMRQYLADRAGCPAEGLTPDDCQRLLNAHRIDPAAAERFMACLTRLFEAGFNADGATQPLRPGDRDAVETAIREIETLWSRGGAAP